MEYRDNTRPKPTKAEILKRKKRKRQILIIRAFLRLFVLIAIAVFAIIGLVKLGKLIFGHKKPAEVVQEAEPLDFDYTAVSADSVSEDNVEPEEPPTYASCNPEAYGFCTGYSVTSDADTGEMWDEEILSTYGVLIDLRDNTIVSKRRADERIYPASMTKILTVLVAAEHITDLDDKVIITQDDTNYAYSHDLSIVGYGIGEETTVKDLLYGTILPSGGDAAHALAVYVAGSEEAFADMMNQKISELGLAGTTHFTNCSGIYNDDHYTTLTDMAMILKAAEENELCHEVLGTRKYTTTPTKEHPDGIEISNWFIRRIEDKDCHGTVMGAKTGFVNESGCCAASYCVSNEGIPYICVTADAWSSWRAIYDHVQIYDDYLN